MAEKLSLVEYVELSGVAYSTLWSRLMASGVEKYDKNKRLIRRTEAEWGKVCGPRKPGPVPGNKSREERPAEKVRAPKSSKKRGGKNGR